MQHSTTPTTLEQRLYNGDRAREVLENEEFIAAFGAIEQELIEAWKTSPARDPEGREKLWAYLHLLAKLKTQLTRTLETGKLAKLDLEHQRGLRQKVKDWIG
jgi:hypothetical protein